MKYMGGKYTIEKFAEQYHLTRQSALNLLSKLKKQGYLTVNGGGKQKRIYTIYRLQKRPTNGFYDIVNLYSPEKLYPKFEHYTKGRYTIEHAIIDGLKIGDIRTLEASKYLFRHVTNWKLLINLAKENDLFAKLLKLYQLARSTIKCKKMPKRYLK